MIDANETFDGTWPFAPRFADINGFRMHYVSEGQGEPIVMLHGEPTWGYLYRRFIPPLSWTHRVVVPDHMGFGKSATPQDREYTLKTHVENLAALVEQLDLRDITFVAQDWGGPICAAYAIRHRQRVRRLCLMNTILGYGGVKQPGLTPWFRWIHDRHEAGELEAVLGNLAVTLPGIMKLIGMQDTSVMTDTWVRAYASAFPDRAACRGAIDFPLDALLRRMVPYVKEGFDRVDRLEALPAMLVEGMRDRAIDPAHAIADFQSLFPAAPVVRLPDAGHFVQEDAPLTCVALIQQFLQMTGPAGAAAPG